MKAILRKDSVWTGLVIGLLIPVGIYGVLRLIYEFMDSVGVFSDVGFAEDFRTRTLILIAICCNLFVMQFYRKTHRHPETIRGMLLSTMICVGIWFWLFGSKMLRF